MKHRAVHQIERHGPYSIRRHLEQPGKEPRFGERNGTGALEVDGVKAAITVAAAPSEDENSARTLQPSSVSQLQALQRNGSVSARASRDGGQSLAIGRLDQRPAPISREVCRLSLIHISEP